MTECDADFLEKLRKLCLEYDTKSELYPESSLEGFAVYYFALHPEHKIKKDMLGRGIDYEDYPEGKEYHAELEKLWGEYTEEEKIIIEKPGFVINLTGEDLNRVITNYFKSDITKKSEFFKEESPDWLADTFIIKSITQTSDYGLSGMCKIRAMDELYVVDERTFTVSENKQKHEVVELIIYNRRDI